MTWDDIFAYLDAITAGLSEIADALAKNPPVDEAESAQLLQTALSWADVLED